MALKLLQDLRAVKLPQSPFRRARPGLTDSCAQSESTHKKSVLSDAFLSSYHIDVLDKLEVRLSGQDVVYLGEVGT